ncbi:RpmF [Schleiferilactobacillus shenzhenensis LY-73]|uniref:Large ribosomal subunit protein bL32 n=2 Tax=Schleiferilactobacillus shenzhenensis TaxID=1231337 RepID=U4TZ06_9LACO|nr:RpmF [Schleiferilactobacillus shenzhenensis LY-73]
MHFDAATGEYRLSHHVSPKGFYKGEQVVKKAEAASEAGSDTSGSDTSASA